jgi:hypothetical protein
LRLSRRKVAGDQTSMFSSGILHNVWWALTKHPMFYQSLNVG